MGANQSSNGSVLNSWKEIASYLGRGVRTVQRYERDLNLPVRRPRGRSRSAVIALVEDLDAWLHHAPMNGHNGSNGTAAAHRPPIVNTAVRQTLADAAELRVRCHELRTAHQNAVASLLANLETSLKVIATIHEKANGASAESSPGQTSKSPLSNSCATSGDD